LVVRAGFARGWRRDLRRNELFLDVHAHANDFAETREKVAQRAGHRRQIGILLDAVRAVVEIEAPAFGAVREEEHSACSALGAPAPRLLDAETEAANAPRLPTEVLERRLVRAFTRQVLQRVKPQIGMVDEERKVVASAIVGIEQSLPLSGSHRK